VGLKPEGGGVIVLSLERKKTCGPEYRIPAKVGPRGTKKKRGWGVSRKDPIVANRQGKTHFLKLGKNDRSI